MPKKKKKKGLMVTIDTSSAEEFQAKLKQKEDAKLNALMKRFNNSHKITSGTRKGIDSIMKKADNRHKVAEKVALEHAEKKKAEKKKKKSSSK